MVEDWESAEIESIIKLTRDFFKKKGYKILFIEKNSRDGGYVTYSNKFGTTKITFYFLPNYEIEVIKQPYFIKGLFKFFLNKPVEKIISLKQKLRNNQEIKDFDMFIKEVKKYLIDEHLI